jgi:hypothetical protein
LDVEEAVLDAISADNRKEKDERKENPVRDSQDLDPEADQRQIE